MRRMLKPPHYVPCVSCLLRSKRALSRLTMQEARSSLNHQIRYQGLPQLGPDDMESSSCPSADEEEVDHSGDEACLEQALEWTGKVDLHRLREVDAFFRHKQSRVIHVLCDEGGSPSAVLGPRFFTHGANSA